MAKKNKKYKKLNPNEFVGLMFDNQEINGILHVLYNKKIFRYSSTNPSLVDKFENKIKKYTGTKYALGLNNGTSALKTALVAIDIKSGDRVLISSYTFIATPASVISIGAIPIPIDLDLINGMDLKNLELELKKGCAAIILVHIQGRTFNIAQVLELAKKYNVPIIEDACQAFASKYGKFHAGTMGDIGVFSFQQYKQISSGEGGMLITNNKKFYKRAKIYSDHGVVREEMSWDTNDTMIGDNLRMNNIQAAILIAQLNKLPLALRLQKRNRRYILKNVDGSKLSMIINSSDINGETGMNILFLTTSTKIADKIIVHAKSKKIEFRKLWEKPYYKHGVFKKYKLTPKNLGTSICVSSEDLSRRLISLSIPPTLSIDDLNIIVREIKMLQKLNYIN